MKRTTFLCTIAILFSAAVRGQRVTVKPLFPCTDTLHEAYGFCSHITRPATDYPLRQTDLKTLREAKATWVRADFDWWTVYPRGVEQGESPQVFDSVVSDCQQYGTQLLPILVVDCKGKRAWDYPDAYAQYLSYLSDRYRGQLRYWEVVNEVNIIRGFDRRELAANYVSVLRQASDILRKTSPENQVVFGGLAEMDEAFLNELGSQHEGYDTLFDVMNFHSYLSPEDLVERMNKLHGIMNQQGWQKPVWITETGYSTPPQGVSVGGFYHEVVPYACKQLGLNTRKCTLGIINTTGTHLANIDEGADDLFSIFGRVKYVDLEDLKALDPKKVPLLLPSAGEYFPAEWIDDLRSYVARGGTLICPTGVPFYYDDFADEHYTNSHGNHADKFHLDFLLWWNDDAKRLSAPEIPAWMEADDEHPIHYRWPFSSNSSARYISTRALKPGDTFTPYLWAGNDQFRGAVAGLFRFNSDLKGNIIMQTRVDSPWRDEAQQARRVARAYLVAFAHGIDRMFWYHLRAFENDPVDWEHYYGVVHRDFSPKPAYEAYQTLTHFCPDGSTRPTLTIDHGLYHAQWRHPALGRVSAYWSVGKSREVKLPRRPRAIYSHLGEKQRATTQILAGSGVTFVIE